MPSFLEIIANPLGSVLSSVLGGVGSAVSQNSANKTNIKLAEMQNDFNREMFDKQVAEQWRQINYNSAANQRSRLEDAGLNPYLMMNGGSAGMATSSPPTPAPAAQVRVDPTISPSAASLFGQAAQNVFQLGEQLAKVQGIQQDNKTKAILNTKYAKILQETINNMIADTKDKKESAFLKGIDHDIKSMSFDSIVNQYQANLEYTRQLRNVTAAQQIQTTLQGMLSYKQLQYFDTNMQQELALKAANIYSLYASGHLSYKLAERATAAAILDITKANGVKIDNDILNDTKDAIIQAAKNTANNNATFDNNISRNWLKFNNTFIKPVLGDMQSGADLYTKWRTRK